MRTRIVVSHALLDRFGNCGIVALLIPCETEIAMLVGYARTSTLGQIAGLEAQERELRAAGCDKVFHEQVSSVAERQQLEAALDYVREGDSFTVTKLDRLARSVGDLLAIVSGSKRRRSASAFCRCPAAIPRHQHRNRQVDAGVIGAVGQAEREAMLERQREGIAKAKRRAAIRAVCRPFSGRRQRSSGSRRQASGPRKSPASWGLAGPVSIGCLARQLAARDVESAPNGAITSPSYGSDRKMPSRPKDWQKIINAEAEVCHWIASDGTRHPCTDEENAEVRRELLIMRTISDKRRQQQSEER